MPYISLRSLWTPLVLIGIYLFKDDHGRYWYQGWSGRHRRLMLRAKRKQHVAEI